MRVTDGDIAYLVQHSDPLIGCPGTTGMSQTCRIHDIEGLPYPGNATVQHVIGCGRASVVAGPTSASATSAGAENRGKPRGVRLSGSSGVSKWQMARSAAWMTGATRSNIGEKSYSPRLVRALSATATWEMTSPVNASVTAGVA